PLLEVAEPYLALAQVIELFHPAEARPASVSQRAEIAADAVLGTDVSVGPFAVIEAASVIGDRVRIGAGTVVGRGSRVGDDSRLMPRVVLYPGTVVGRRCIIHSGVVLGGDGFGFATSAGRHHKVPHIGHVAVGDDVEIGANTTVDRGALTATEIGSGSKLDNLVMIAHGVVVGDGCLIAAQSGIAGSARVGARVTLAGQVGVVGHVKIADGTVVASKSAVMQDVERGQLIAGIPAVDHREWKRAQALSRKLPELRAEMRELSRRIDQLEHRSPEED
ncbi:MAG TPA: UDP-3-O-(3-hydroxymyristoyl)glucosamine N-acyltransferase, partial [Candidatus Polarisedimenticolaceae bacterium]|nr:UDP-3-O-(3-hydroxymyristoyl)glucosamine N-acyltransferase [Candidatus Polarisedimenticolaceae bacterium]